MDAFNDFIHMGGYAAYVWSSYGIALLAFGLSVVLPLKEKRQIEKRIRRIIQNEQSSGSE
ncbi:hypothetical protein MNBD_GAMMA23-423 [hydrothermal vent metagenome]|uniref:Cytochrome c-type biogenesis protein CcmD n=1 Tax=hydrothermal vent metagenome TaxID=652676 RepID=A0A3B0ZYD5_9ZZZZ